MKISPCFLLPIQRLATRQLHVEILVAIVFSQARNSDRKVIKKKKPWRVIIAFGVKGYWILRCFISTILNRSDCPSDERKKL